jgi:hypothetical protein
MQTKRGTIRRNLERGHHKKKKKKNPKRRPLKETLIGGH